MAGRLVAPLLSAFTSGLHSPWLAGRLDMDRQPASLRHADNFVVTPQGPLVRRPGLLFHSRSRSDEGAIAIVPFVFSNDQAWQIEFSSHSGTARLLNDDGILAYDPLDVTAQNTVAANLTLFIPGHYCDVGDQLVLSAPSDASDVNGRVLDVLSVSGEQVEFDMPTPATPVDIVGGVTARLVYEIPHDYDADDLAALRHTQRQDTVFLFSGTRKPKRLERRGAFDWRLVDFTFKDGPYGPLNLTPTRLKPSATGNAVPTMTSATAPSGAVTQDGGTGWHAFDEDRDTYWESSTDQKGWLAYEFDVAVAVNGYTFDIPRNSPSADYVAKDYAPGSWEFLGSHDGSTWVLLDAKNDYEAYDGRRSLYFDIENDVAYKFYKLDVTACRRNGPIRVRIGRLAMTTTASRAIEVQANSTTGINSDAGFAETDAGRQIRLEGSDGSWRDGVITERIGSDRVAVLLRGDPLSNVKETRSWRLGLYSDTTGWPTVGEFLNARLYMGGGSGFPDTVAASIVNGYDTFSPTEAGGDVTDENGFTFTLDASQSARVAWMAADAKGLLLGTGSGEYLLSPSEQKTAIGPRNIDVKPMTFRGSHNAAHVRAENAVLFIQYAREAVHETAFVFEADGFKSPSMTLLAAHLGAPKFKKIVYMAEPLSLLVGLRDDGSIALMTYNRAESVVGWTEFHTDGVVEDVSVIPTTEGTKQSTLWAVVVREIDGEERRFNERMAPWWTFTSELLDARFVDCGVVYSGDAVSTLYGLSHLEGEALVGLVDGAPLAEPLTVVDGSVTLPNDDEAEDIVLGVGYRSLALLAQQNLGAQNGTLQGKTLRLSEVALRLWSSVGGRVGRAVDKMTPLKYRTPGNDLDEAVPLFTGDTEDMAGFDGKFTRDAAIWIDQPADKPLPLNIVAVMPQYAIHDN